MADITLHADDGSRLRAARDAAGLSRHAVAGSLGWSVARLKDYEGGKTSPTLRDLRALAGLYGIDPKELAFGTEGSAVVWLRGLEDGIPTPVPRALLPDETLGLRVAAVHLGRRQQGVAVIDPRPGRQHQEWLGVIQREGAWWVTWVRSMEDGGWAAREEGNNRWLRVASETIAGRVVVIMERVA